MKITWSLLARNIVRPATEAGLNIEGLIIDGLRSASGFPFAPKRLVLAIRFDTEVGEMVEGVHQLILLVSDADGIVIQQIEHEFRLPANQRNYVLLLPLKGEAAIQFPKATSYQFNLILDNGAASSDFVIRVR